MLNKNFIQALLFIGIAFGALIGGTLVANKLREPTKIELPPEIVIPTIKCPKDFGSFEKLLEKQIVKLIEKKTSAYASSGDFVNPIIVITKKSGVGSDIACGYLFIKAGTESGGPLKNWENVYINPFKIFGGHLVRDKAVVNREKGNLTEILFSLKEITYRKSRDTEEIGTTDWSALLNVFDKVEFNISLNTENRTGFIEEVSIAYKCWNPETGQETFDCKLEIVERRGL